MDQRAYSTKTEASCFAGWKRMELAVVAVIMGLGTWWLYKNVIAWLFQVWGSNQDYSHGYFIFPISAAYLIANSGKLNVVQDERRRLLTLVLTVTLMSIALGVHMFGILLGSRTVQGLSLLIYLSGVLTAILGVSAVRWVLPAVGFLLFMLPLPNYIAGGLSGSLQSIATLLSTTAIQILGISAVAEGNIIQLSHGQIGVAEACSGIRMLYSFVALTLATCMFVDRGPLEKLLIAMSAVPIAIVVNCMRIVATAIAHEYLDSDTANSIFHDYAGWAMMPMGFFLLFLFLLLLEHLFIERESAGRSPT